ncbi:MAG TPA: AAA family ATPase [Acidocella sp.]|nr:MAG: hypothetical protein B7Z77_08505 [Acidocella sp. 20-58-15]HQT39642.1 AAA family ATPase [Acidocella sp.]
MKTLAILSRKGGAGKTTLAIHMAVIAQAAGRRVLIIDCDPQKSATKWFESRDAGTPELISAPADSLAMALPAARADGVDLVIVDSRPSVEGDAAQIAARADFALIPSRPSILDLQAIGDTVSIVKLAKCSAAVVLNACPPARGVGEASVTQDARSVLSGYQIEVAPVSIAVRVAFCNALIDGRAVNELEPNGKAAVEMLKLWKWTEAKLWQRRQS